MILLVIKPQRITKHMYSKNQKLIYADHSATTKVRAEVIEIMNEIYQEDFGNPSSIHSFGRKAKCRLDESRRDIASVINANEEQIIFTSGGTESNNLVLQGIERLFNEGHLQKKEKHIISTKIEHPSVKEPLEYLEKRGWEITWLDADKEGFINTDELNSCISSSTSLVSIIHSNNEIGTIQNLKSISEICKKNNVLFHTDAVQSFCKIPINVQDVNIDFMSMSGHKIYGPKGIGALYIKSLKTLSPLFLGGSQENKLRPGTENLPGIVGFAKAAKLLNNEMSLNSKKLRSLQINLMEKLSLIENVILTGVSLNKVKENIPEEKYLYRIPGHVSVCCRGIDGESLVLRADLKGIAASSGSACKSKQLNQNESNFEPSYVLLSIGVPKDCINGSLRLSLGVENIQEEVIYIASAVKDIVMKLQNKPALLK